MFLVIYHLSILQECSYDIKRYLRYYLKNGYKKDFIFYIFYILIALFYSNYLLILFLIPEIYNFLLIKKKKVKFVITNRVKRYIFSLLIIFLFNMFFLHFILFYIFSNLVILLTYFINYPLERLIYKKYYSKAKKFFSEYRGIKIAITGSYGKTSVKNYLYQILEKKYSVYKTPKSYNTPMGIAKSINEINSLTEIIIIEMGAAKKNDIKELMDMVKPDISLLISIGPQHLNTFKSIDNIINEKVKIIDLLENNKTGFIYNDNNLIKKHKFNEKINLKTYGFKDGIYTIKTDYKNNFSVYKNSLLYDKYKTNILGRYNHLNILAALTVADYLKLDKSEIKESVKNLKQVEKRMEIKKINDNLIIIDDSYNSNILGSIQALEVLNTFDYEKWIITPGFVEIDKIKKKHHHILSKMIDKVCDQVILINKKNTKDFIITKPSIKFNSFIEGYNYFLQNKKEKSVLLIENDLPDHY